MNGRSVWYKGTTERQIALAKLLLIWSRSIEEHGMQFPDWIRHQKTRRASQETV